MVVRIVLGIDATNLRQGGGRTHLIEFLRVVSPAKHGISRIVVWGSRETLTAIEDRPWIDKVCPPALEGGLLRRAIWQRFSLAGAARTSSCDVLFVPGGSYFGNFHPVVTMSRNMLPFEMRELRRYGFSTTTLRLLALRFIQSRSLRRSDGVIFLTRYAQEVVQRITGRLSGITAVVPHGLSGRFTQAPKVQRSILDYSEDMPYRILYVSIVDQYKHQWHVVEAIGKLRTELGWPIALDLVGPAYPPALSRLQRSLARWDPERNWVTYHGAAPYSEVHNCYANADLGLFASSCENMPNILMEIMASGLPVASSNRGPMREILKEGGAYFNPEEPVDIARCLNTLISDPQLRTRLIGASQAVVGQYSWQRCAAETCELLAKASRPSNESAGSCAV